jgi:hypothetical protein
MRQHHYVRTLKYILFAFVLILPTIVSAQTTQNGNSAAQPVQVPDWMAWRVFHDGLASYFQRSGDTGNSMLAKKFGLTSADAQTLLTAGQAFVEAIKRIETDARTEAQRRYGNAVTPRSAPTGPIPRSAMPLQKSFRERAMEDGLYAQVEGRKQAALNSHIQELRRELDGAKVDRVQAWVQASVAPRIKTFTLSSQARAANEHGVQRPSSGK